MSMKMRSPAFPGRIQAEKRKPPRRRLSEESSICFIVTGPQVLPLNRDIFDEGADLILRKVAFAVNTAGMIRGDLQDFFFRLSPNQKITIGPSIPAAQLFIFFFGHFIILLSRGKSLFPLLLFR
jgi:hypothetical protein